MANVEFEVKGEGSDHSKIRSTWEALSGGLLELLKRAGRSKKTIIFVDDEDAGHDGITPLISKEEVEKRSRRGTRRW